MIECLAARGNSAAVAIQERRGLGYKLESLQKQARDLGYHGAWSPVQQTDKGGTPGGFAALTKSHIR